MSKEMPEKLTPEEVALLVDKAQELVANAEALAKQATESFKEEMAKALSDFKNSPEFQALEARLEAALADRVSALEADLLALKKRLRHVIF